VNGEGELVAAITAFNKARLDEDEWIARQADDEWERGFGGLRVTGESPFAGQWTDDHIARNDPARALRQVAAGRRILERHSADETGDCQGCANPYSDGLGVQIDDCPEQRDLASWWSDHPEYRARWKP
jgi:Family of unknown function (DUF6221)